jgi:O-methyltransferase domain/Dimerisation domain
MLATTFPDPSVGFGVMPRMSQDEVKLSESDRMMQMVTGYWISQLIHGAATFSLADHLAKRPMTAQEFAAAAGLAVTPAFRFLRACASFGLLHFDGNGHFATTALLDTLRKDNPGSLRGVALALTTPGHWLPWGRLPEAVKTGQSQTEPALGKPLFEYYATMPEEAAVFTEAMRGMTASVASEAIRLIDTTSVKTVVDVGGAEGMLLHALLTANRALTGVVLDLPNIVTASAAAAKEAGLEKRLTAVGGDFFKAVPAADLYVLKYILHDWDDQQCIRILQNCRQAMLPGGRVVVIELLLGETGQPGLAPLMDVNMMVMMKGRERSPAEYRQLLEAAGLRFSEMRIANQMAFIEATAM